MEKIWLQGNLSENSFASLLFRIWKTKHSGSLTIQTGKQKEQFDFKKGNICFSAAAIDNKTLLNTALEQSLISAAAKKNIRQYAQDNKIPVFTVLNEKSNLDPEQLWDLLETSAKSNLFPMFDWDKAAYSFNSEHTWEEHEILLYLSTIDMILEGVRRMKNYTLIKNSLPKEDSQIQISPPEYADHLHLSPAEIYLYHVIEKDQCLRNIYKMSRLGKKDSQKIIFSFFSLGIATRAQQKKPSYSTTDFSHADLHNLVDAFNQKCSFIFKYITKEIGPAAANVLEKCLEEIRPQLSPYFQDLNFDPEGKLNPGPLFKSGPTLSGGDTKRVLLRDLNEILAAEVLAVKKNLGKQHEADLIQHLEKID